jgi:uncharacterized protein
VLSLEVKIAPRASRDEIGVVRDGVLGIRVTAPPVDDAANRAVVKLIARRLGVAPSRVRIARGARGRRKRIEIEGVGPEALERLTGRRA